MSSRCSGVNGENGEKDDAGEVDWPRVLYPIQKQVRAARRHGGVLFDTGWPLWVLEKILGGRIETVKVKGEIL